jgi:hypothetical protein
VRQGGFSSAQQFRVVVYWFTALWISTSTSLPMQLGLPSAPVWQALPVFEAANRLV